MVERCEKYTLCQLNQPIFCPQIDSEEWNKTQGQTVLRTWEVESAHNYENNQDIKMVNSSNILCFTFSFFSGC